MIDLDNYEILVKKMIFLQTKNTFFNVFKYYFYIVEIC